jgi:hypothetical protein
MLLRFTAEEAKDLIQRYLTGKAGLSRAEQDERQQWNLHSFSGQSSQLL